MSKIIKNCIRPDCLKPYKTNFFEQRSKYCSRKCLSLHKKVLRAVREKSLRSQKRTEKQQKALEKVYIKKRKEREMELAKITAANKAIAMIKGENGEYQYGENMLTLKNYKEPLKRIPIEEGIGWYGTLAADIKTGKVQCHICGQLVDVLNAHALQSHKMSARDYREKFGLAYKTALVSEKVRMHMKQKTLAWLKTMTPEEKEAHLQKLKHGQTLYRKTKKVYTQPKITIEGMNMHGSCPDQTLQQIIDLKNEIGHVPSKREFIELKGSQRFVHLAYKHFGSWKKAIEMCHFDDADFYGRRIERGKNKNYTDDELLEYLRIYAEEYQQIPTASDWKRDLLPDHDTYVKHFGTIENARQLAGVYNILELNKNMLTRSKHYRAFYKATKPLASS